MGRLSKPLMGLNEFQQAGQWLVELRFMYVGRWMMDQGMYVGRWMMDQGPCVTHTHTHIHT